MNPVKLTDSFDSKCLNNAELTIIYLKNATSADIEDVLNKISHYESTS